MMPLLAFFLSLSSPAVELNKGRKLMQAGNLPMAILIYRDALRDFKTDRELQQDLAAARELVAYPRDDLRPAVSANWRHRLDEREYFSAFALTVIVAAFSYAKLATTRPRWAGPILLVSFSTSTIMIFMAVSRFHEQLEFGPPFAVVKGAIVLHSGNGESYPAALDSPLPAGAEVTVLHFRGAWAHVELPGNIFGWIRRSDLLLGMSAQALPGANIR